MANTTYLKSSLNWDKLIEEYRTSGKTAEKWCNEHGFRVISLDFRFTNVTKQKRKYLQMFHFFQ